jgi:hypothetical protein
MLTVGQKLWKLMNAYTRTFLGAILFLVVWITGCFVVIRLLHLKESWCMLGGAITYQIASFACDSARHDRCPIERS